MNRWGALAMLLALAGGLALRLPQLALRPLHNDEAVNATKLAELWQQGRYAYDPDEYHGPTLHYASLPFLWLSGSRTPENLEDSTLRLAPVAFGLGLILLLALMADGLSRPALAWSALFIAVSPAMVFYSRYFIHEMLLVFFTALTLGAGWRYARTRAPGWAMLAGAGVALMFATKETFVISVAAMGLAAAATIGWPKANRTPPPAAPALWNWRHALLTLGTSLVVWLLLFSSFFTHFQGCLDSALTYLPWLKRAGGHSPHIHPWYFYLQRLAWFHAPKGPVWSEGLILGLAALGAVVSLRADKPPLHRFLALYTLILTAAYSAISYKTPWCLLSFLHGMILLAGLGAAALTDLLRHRHWKLAGIAALIALSLQLAWQAWRAAFIQPADRRNPYVYAQTVPDLLNLVRRIDGIARVSETGYDTVVKIIAPESDYWPLPWYLRRFKHVGWFDKLPHDPLAPIVAVSSKLGSRLDDKSERKWIMAELAELRPGIFFELYVELELWKKYVATLPRDRE